MVELNYKLISGILFLVLVVSGTTFYIQDTGEKTGCRASWQFVSVGDNAGDYGCTTGSGTRYQTCFDVYDSANTQNYWCKKGILIKVESGNPSGSPDQMGEIFHCTKSGCSEN